MDRDGTDHFTSLEFLFHKVPGLDLSLVFKLVSGEFLWCPRRVPTLYINQIQILMFYKRDFPVR